ncbi:ribose-phosphate pyrophosphokinase [Candidatus Saccharibacteria bacterium]|nr:ribose-phosphate pyrophosphokinase [Candidatus Saccharibacteria bacterium]
MAESFYVLKGDKTKYPVMFSSFPDGDIHAIVEKVTDCKNQSVLLFHRLYPNQNSRLIQLLFTIDVMREHGAKDISVFIPYLPYSRQDKRYIPGEAISADAVCRMLSKAGCKTLYVLDCHFMKGPGEQKRGGLTIHNLSVGDQLIASYKKSVGKAKFDVIGPDAGASYLTQNHGSKNMKKVRGEYKDLSVTDSDSYRDIQSLDHEHINHDHNNVLIIDDMISTGSTIIKATEMLKAKGIKNVACATTHAFFLRGSYTILSETLDAMLYTDSIEQPSAVIKVEDIFDKKIMPLWQKG